VTWIGGKAKRRTQCPHPKKDMVADLRERSGRVKFIHVPDGKADTIRKALNKQVVAGHLPTRLEQKCLLSREERKQCVHLCTGFRHFESYAYREVGII